MHKYNNSGDAVYNSTNFVRGPFEDRKGGFGWPLVEVFAIEGLGWGVP